LVSWSDTGKYWCCTYITPIPSSPQHPPTHTDPLPNTCRYIYTKNAKLFLRNYSSMAAFNQSISFHHKIALISNHIPSASFPSIFNRTIALLHHMSIEIMSPLFRGIIGSIEGRSIMFHWG
jgi:hypothetical protein